jgi:hypothetical protein
MSHIEGHSASRIRRFPTFPRPQGHHTAYPSDPHHPFHCTRHHSLASPGAGLWWAAGVLAPKYAVLLGLLDVLMERTSAKGEPPSVVTTRELAEKVTELYWPQADAFGVGVAPRALR